MIGFISSGKALDMVNYAIYHHCSLRPLQLCRFLLANCDMRLIPEFQSQRCRVLLNTVDVVLDILVAVVVKWTVLQHKGRLKVFVLDTFCI